MTRIICLASGKGGVGKTTLTANLAAALAGFKKSVIAIDSSLGTSNLGFHLGIPLYPRTVQDIMNKDVRVKDSIYYHKSGFMVIPADISLKKIIVPRASEFVDIFYTLIGDADFILIDSAAGLGQESLAAVEAADELITVTNPELPAITDALKLGEIAKALGTRNIGVVINRIRNEKHEMPVDDVKDFLDLPIIGQVPEDRSVMEAVASKEPVVTHKPKSHAAQHFKAIAAYLIGEEYKVKKPFSFFGWLK